LRADEGHGRRIRRLLSGLPRHDEAGEVRDLFVAGRYLDEYACRDGEWRITSRLLVTDWVKDDPGSLDFFAANPGVVRGGRLGADPSQIGARS
jgi:hypothetical protein